MSKSIQLIACALLMLGVSITPAQAAYQSWYVYVTNTNTQGTVYIKGVGNSNNTNFNNPCRTSTTLSPNTDSDADINNPTTSASEARCELKMNDSYPGSEAYLYSITKGSNRCTFTFKSSSDGSKVSVTPSNEGTSGECSVGSDSDLSAKGNIFLGIKL